MASVPHVCELVVLRVNVCHFRDCVRIPRVSILFLGRGEMEREVRRVNGRIEGLGTRLKRVRLGSMWRLWRLGRGKGRCNDGGY